MAISSRDPLVAEAGKQGQADSEFSGVEGSIFVSPSKCQTED